MVVLPGKNNNGFSGKNYLNKRKWSKLRYLNRGLNFKK